MWQIRAREADYPIPLTTAIAFPGWANNIGIVLYTRVLGGSSMKQNLVSDWPIREQVTLWSSSLNSTVVLYRVTGEPLTGSSARSGRISLRDCSRALVELSRRLRTLLDTTKTTHRCLVRLPPSHTHCQTCSTRCGRLLAARPCCPGLRHRPCCRALFA